MKELFKTFGQNSGSKTLTGLSEKAEGILSKAVELWPILQRPFAKDPIEDAIESDNSRGHKISDLFLPTWYSWHNVTHVCTFFKHDRSLSAY